MNHQLLLEAMDDVLNNISADDPLDTQLDSDGKDVDEDALLKELNSLYTPILIQQSLEKDISAKSNAESALGGTLTERSIIAFDDEARMAQLIAVCAKLIAKQKNTAAWQEFEKAAAIKRQSELNIQKEENEAAKTLAQKYLVMVSTTNLSSTARDAAKDLLPQTQH